MKAIVDPPPRGLKDPKDPKAKVNPSGKNRGSRTSAELCAQTCATRDLRTIRVISKGRAVPESFSRQAAISVEKIA